MRRAKPIIKTALVLAAVVLIAAIPMRNGHTTDGLTQPADDLELPDPEPPEEPAVPEPPAEPEPDPEPEPEPDPEPEPEPDSDPQPEPEPEPEPQPDPPPQILLDLVDGSGHTLEEIPYNQLVVARSDGNTAEIFAFERDDTGAWTEFMGSTPGHVGRSGVIAAADKREGDMKTPIGLYPLPFAFGVQPDPGTRMEYRQAVEGCYWVDDPKSSLYNQWVEGTADRDWDSAEYLWRVTGGYAYAAVIGYNMDPIEPGHGSAIFLHCGEGTTAGCVSLPTENMKELLLWMDPDRNPGILIF